MNRADLDQLLLRARGVAALRGVLDSEAGQNLLTLLRLLAVEKPDPELVAGACSHLWGELARAPEPVLEDAWQAHLVERILERSEEHTSELQSRQYLECRLLLEKNNL